MIVLLSGCLHIHTRNYYTNGTKKKALLINFQNGTNHRWFNFIKIKDSTTNQTIYKSKSMGRCGFFMLKYR